MKNKQNKNHKVILNLIQDLQRLPLLLVNNLRGRSQIKFGMTSLFNNATLTTHGFTLIELLVVVLIIGILAAVAVPQYQKAVDKSRYIQLITMITSIKKAQEIHYLATGEYTNRFNQLDIDLPPGATVKIINNVQKEQLRYSNNMAYDINFSKTTGYDDNTGMRLIYNYDHASEYSEGSANELLCYGVPNDTRRQRVCKSFGGTPIEEGSRFFRLPN